MLPVDSCVAHPLACMQPTFHTVGGLTADADVTAEAQRASGGRMQGGAQGHRVPMRATAVRALLLSGLVACVGRHHAV